MPQFALEQAERGVAVQSSNLFQNRISALLNLLAFVLSNRPSA
jgi:hypothetical protein